MAGARRILLTNDDGYASEGIQVLADSLESLAEVWVVAPRIEQSAVSHALTLDRPLRIERLGDRRYAVDGTPTDCVALGVASLMGEAAPDLVVSGINFGGNMGVDVHYSGTVSAAFEGVILGCPALAVSQVRGEGFSFHVAAAIGVDPRPRPRGGHAPERQRAPRPAPRRQADKVGRPPLHRGRHRAGRPQGKADLLDRRR
jgi:5'-nucleotidase